MAVIPLLLTLLAVSHVSAKCNYDNCYRGLQGYSHAASATAFCSSYMAPGFTGSIPTYAAACSSSAVRISSACNCLTITTSGSSSTSSTTSTTSSTSSTVSSATLTTLSTAASTCQVTIIQTNTVFVTMPTCMPTTTSSETDTTSSTVTTTYIAYPTDFVEDPGFEYGGSFWRFQGNASIQIDGASTPCHSGRYSGRLSAVGPTLPDGSDAQDANAAVSLLGNGPPPDWSASPGGSYLFTAYIYIVSATSTDSTAPTCLLTFSVTGQEIFSYNINTFSFPGVYRNIRQLVDVASSHNLTADLSCPLSSGGGQYSATVLVDDVYFFGGSFAQCQTGQK